MNTKILLIIISFMFSIALVHKCAASESMEEYIARKTSVLNDLSEHLQMHSEHLEDYKDSLQILELYNSANFSILNTTTTTNIASIRQHKEMIDLLKNPDFFQGQYFLSKGKNGFLEKIDIVVDQFFNRRFELLCSRSENLKTIRTKKEGKHYNYPCTTDPARQIELTDIEKVMANITTDSYQTFNKVILGLLSLTDLCLLPQAIKKQIRMSPSLWPLITMPSDDFGHPDEAIEINDDLNLYRHCVLKEANVDVRRESLACPAFSTHTAAVSAAVVPSASIPFATTGLKKEVTTVAGLKKKKTKKSKGKAIRDSSENVPPPFFVATEIDAAVPSAGEISEKDAAQSDIAQSDSDQEAVDTSVTYEIGTVSLISVCGTTSATSSVPVELQEEYAGTSVLEQACEVDEQDPKLIHEAHQQRKRVIIPFYGIN
ncbi:MAG: hypothetical protein V4482_01835 [Pseudomonadota bacterium]